MLDSMKNPYNIEDCMTEILNSCCSKEEIKAITFEELEDEGSETPNIIWLGEKQPVMTDRHFKSLDLSNKEIKHYVPSIESPPVLKLKNLQSYLKYVYVGDNNTLSVIISYSLNADKEKSLEDALGRYKKANE